MGRIITRLVVSSAAFCIGQAAWAGDRLSFWPSGGDHGIDACVFTTMPSPEEPAGFGRLLVGVAADTATLEPVGIVKLRHDGAAPGPRLLELGAGAETLLSVPLNPTGAHTVRATMPAGPARDLMGSLLQRTGLWLRIDGAAARPVAIGGTEQQVTSCIVALERDLADERAARARGDLTTSFPSLKDDD
jgi:hypothetical protein